MCELSKPLESKPQDIKLQDAWNKLAQRYAQHLRLSSSGQNPPWPNIITHTVGKEGKAQLFFRPEPLDNFQFDQLDILFIRYNLVQGVSSARFGWQEGTPQVTHLQTRFLPDFDINEDHLPQIVDTFQMTFQTQDQQ